MFGGVLLVGFRELRRNFASSVRESLTAPVSVGLRLFSCSCELRFFLFRYQLLLLNRLDIVLRPVNLRHVMSLHLRQCGTVLRFELCESLFHLSHGRLDFTRLALKEIVGRRRLLGARSPVVAEIQIAKPRSDGGGQLWIRVVVVDGERR